MRTIKSWPARLFAKLFVLFLSLTMLGTWSGNAMAANCISIAASNWNVQTTWGPAGTGCAGATGGIPGAADTVTIATNVSMNVASTTVSALTINSGSTLTLNATPLIVSGNITNNGTITAGGTDILQSTGATAVLSGSGTFAGSARLYFSGATPNIAAGAVQTFTGTTNRVYVGSNNGTTVNSVLTINGTLASTVANGNFLRIYGTSGVTVAAAGVINASTSTITYRSANETVTNNGTVSIATVTGNNATTSIWTNAANSTLNVYTTLLSTGTLNASATGASTLIWL